MPSVISANRPDVSKSFSVCGFTIRTGTSPAWFEVVLTTDPTLLDPQNAARRTASNFYSTRDLGPLLAERGEAVFLVPARVLDRFVGSERLYYAVATFASPDRRNPEVARLPADAVPSVYISKSFTGSPRRLNAGAGPSNGYGTADPATLTWAGDEPRAGESLPAQPSSTIAPAPGTAPANDAAAAAQALEFEYRDGLEDVLGPLPPVSQLSTIPLDPGVGGMSIGTSALAVGDIIVSTTSELISEAIRRVTSSPVSHAMLYVGDGLVVEAIGGGVQLRPIETAIEHATVAVAFRHPTITEAQALLVKDFAGNQIGKPYNYWGIARQLRFIYDRARHCSRFTGADYDRCVNWVGKVDLGSGSDDEFFCSQLVLAAYEAAGLPLTAQPPHWGTPGDIADLRLTTTLAYVGHLKAPVTATLGIIGDARAMSGQSYDVNWNDVPLIPQPTGVSCWATAFAMLLNWSGHHTTPAACAAAAGLTTKVGLDPDLHATAAHAVGLVGEPPQSYTIDGFRSLLERYGPQWVGVITSAGGAHAVVVTGMYSDGAPDGSDTFVRILDPWDRAAGPAGAPGPYAATHATGSRYVLTWAEFVREYESRVTTNAHGDVNLQIAHAAGTGGRTIGTGTTVPYTLSARAFSVPVSVGWHDVPLFPDENGWTSWECGFAAILRWWGRPDATPGSVASAAIRDAATDFPRRAAAVGLVTQQAPPDAAGLAAMLRDYGPVCVTGNTRNAPHSVVVVGVDTGNGGTVAIQDPWDVSPGPPGAPRLYATQNRTGTRYSLDWAVFQHEFLASGHPVVHATGNGGRTPDTAPRADVYPRTLSGEECYDVNWDDVQLVPQPNNVSCWATSAAMVIGWRDRVSLTPATIAEIAGRPLTRGLNPDDRRDLAAALGLVAEEPQSYLASAFRSMLEHYGPIWVAARTPLGNHAVVVTGMYDDGSGPLVRIADPWDRTPGPAGAPGPYLGTHAHGSRYVLTWHDFTTEYELRITTNAAGTVNAQIMHAHDTGGRTIGSGTQHAYTAGLAEGMSGGAEVAGAIAGAVVTRVLDNDGDVHWELEQLSGLKHVGDNAANAGNAQYRRITTTVAGPRAWTTAFRDRIWADFEVRWECNGRSLGNITIVPVGNSDAAFAGLNVKATIGNVANAYTRPPSTERFAAVRLLFSYRFSLTFRDDYLANTELVLYGDGTYDLTTRWTQ